MKLCIVGRNIAYSLSPFIHTQFARVLGLDIDYTLRDVQDGDFREMIAHLQHSGFYGCNITVPYKEEAFLMATHTSASAQKAHSANVFVFEKEGEISASSTDGVGLTRDFKRLQLSLAWKDVLVCGTGGAAHGILEAIVTAGPRNLTIVSRKREKAEALALAFSTRAVHIKPATYAEIAGRSFDAVIDTTSAIQLKIPESVRLNNGSFVYDLKYSPEGPTRSMQWGLAKGAVSVFDGLGMLVEQAAEAFSIWTGKVPETLPVLKDIKVSFYQYESA